MTAGIWAMGLFILTVLVRVALPIEMGQLRSPYADHPSSTSGLSTFRR